MTIYIDLDSGTVLNGPIFKVNVESAALVEALCDNDDVARAYAEEHGKQVF